MTPDEQLNLWVDGNSVHNDTRDECCPDFSCCCPDLQADLETRIYFRDHPEERSRLLTKFLVRMLEENGQPGQKVYVTGSREEGKE